MKAISLHQPWATLWVLGAKIHETRHWATKIRGPIAVHAAKRWTGDQADLLEREPFRSVLAPYLRRERHPLPLGAFVGVVNLVGCEPVENVLAESPTEIELAFGDFSPGRFAWRASEFWRAEPPLPARGRQGFWEITDAELEELRALVRKVA